jgi:membrane protein
VGTTADVARTLRPRAEHGIVRPIAEAFVQHNLLTYAAAIAFQGLIALVPLALLGLALLGAAGREDVWTGDVAPKLHGRVLPQVYDGIDATARKVLSNGSPGLIVFAAVLSTWYLTAALRAVMEALNRVHDVNDERPWWHRLGVALGLGVLTGVCLVGSAILLLTPPSTHGAATALLDLARWLAAVLLLGLVVGMLVRFAPAERPEARWASAGAVLVVASWIVASVAFRFWITDVVNFRSPIGSLSALLVLTSYLFVSAIVFLVGAQLDELLRKTTGGRAHSLLDLARAALGR